jgi:hypothetical protein
MGNETIRNIGFEADVEVVQVLAPQVIADATPVLSAAIDLRTYARDRFLLVCNVKETTATAHTITFTVTESATSGGDYTAATTSGTMTALSADGVRFCSIKRNTAMPFIKVTATGSHADVDVIVAAELVTLGTAI